MLISTGLKLPNTSCLQLWRCVNKDYGIQSRHCSGSRPERHFIRPWQPTWTLRSFCKQADGTTNSIRIIILKVGSAHGQAHGLPPTKGKIMIYKTRPIFVDGYGFDDTPLEVGPVGWCLLTIARIWMAFAFLFAIAVGIVMIALCSPLALPLLGYDVLADRLLPLRQKKEHIKSLRN